MMSYETEDAIYSSVPNEHIEKVDTSNKNLILELLKEKPGTFFNVKKIASECGYPLKGTCVEVRKAVTEMIEEDGQPIVGNPKGFAYALSSNMLNFYANALENRLQGLQRRINSVRKIAAEMARSEHGIKEYSR